MNRSAQWHRAWCLAVLLSLGICGVYYLYWTPPVRLDHDLYLFPMSVGEWRGEAIDVAQVPLKSYKAQEEIARIYRDRADREVTLYIGYFWSQEQGRELVSYRSKQVHRTAVEMEISLGPGQFYRVNRVLVTEGRESQAIFFWYDLNGRVVTNRYLAKLITLADALTRARTNGAMVAVSLPPGRSSEPRHPAEAELAFLRELLPTVRSYLRSRVA